MKMKEIAVCPDDNFVLPCCVLIGSILKNNDDVHINIVYSNLSEKSKDKIKETVCRFEKSKPIQEILAFYDIGDACSNFSIYDNRFSLTTYNRILLPSVMDENVEKVLYLDCDMIVTRSLDDLFKTDIENYAVGAVYDVNGDLIHFYNRLHYSYDEGYFNAGMLLVNLSYWRKNEISKAIISFVANNKGTLLNNDQDALNGVLHGKWKKLSATYNAMFPLTFQLPLGQVAFCEINLLNEMIKQSENPVIVHYIGIKKPWHKEYKDGMPLQKVWEYYEKLANVRIKRKSCFKGVLLLRQKIRNLAVTLHLWENRTPSYIDTTEIEERLLSTISKN